MRAIRLFVLGMLARHGPMHGHQIRRTAQMDRAELWADVKPGALYGALHRMADEGAITIVCTEQEGNRPARTVYAITDDGRRELVALRNQALSNTRLRPDPFDLALQFCDDLAAEDLRAAIVDRCAAIAAQLAFWRRLRQSADPYLSELEKATFGHTLARLEAEVAWYDDLLDRLPTLLEPKPVARTEPPVPDEPDRGGPDE